MHAERHAQAKAILEMAQQLFDQQLVGESEQSLRRRLQLTPGNKELARTVQLNYAETSGLGVDPQQPPPVPRCVQHAHDRHAVRAGHVEDEEVVEVFDAPLAQACQLG